ncbi:MAG: hypothetical protein ACXVYY_00935 [Oryzihumus sp.]
MELNENRYVVFERSMVDGKLVEKEIEDCFVLLPDTPYGTTALMALARCWAGLDADVAKDLRQLAVDWAPPVADFPELESGAA